MSFAAARTAASAARVPRPLPCCRRSIRKPRSSQTESSSGPAGQGRGSGLQRQHTDRGSVGVNRKGVPGILFQPDEHHPQRLADEPRWPSGDLEFGDLPQLDGARVVVEVLQRQQPHVFRHDRSVPKPRGRTWR